MTRRHPAAPGPSRLARAAVAGAVALTLLVQAPPAAHAKGTQLDARLCQTMAPTKAEAISTLWHLERLKMSEAWQLADGSGVTIAVIDTGTSNVNSKLMDPEQITTLNYVPLEDEEKLNPRGVGDTQQGINCAHGTSVTSIIVGTPMMDTRTAYSGIAPKAKIIAMRSLKSQVNEQGAAEKEDPRYTIAAINDAVDRKVDVINISQAMSGGTPEYEKAIKRAIDAGIVVVAAAGNASQGIQGPAYPAAYPGVIAVGMSNPQDIAPAEAAHSHEDMEITVAAPGEGVVALGPSQPLPKGKSGDEALIANQAYITQTGTSFSTPIVSGVVALMLQRNPDMTPAQVKQRLIETADPPSASAPDPFLGHGVVHPLRALTGPAAPTQGHPSATSSPAPIAPRETPTVDRRPMWVALTAAAAAVVLAGGGLVLRLVVPAASKRKYAAAKR